MVHDKKTNSLLAVDPSDDQAAIHNILALKTSLNCQFTHILLTQLNRKIEASIRNMKKEFSDIELVCGNYYEKPSVEPI